MVHPGREAACPREESPFQNPSSPGPPDPRGSRLPAPSRWHPSAAPRPAASAPRFQDSAAAGSPPNSAAHRHHPPDPALHRNYPPDPEAHRSCLHSPLYTELSLYAYPSQFLQTVGPLRWAAFPHPGRRTAFPPTPDAAPPLPILPNASPTASEPLLLRSPNRSPYGFRTAIR